MEFAGKPAPPGAFFFGEVVERSRYLAADIVKNLYCKVLQSPFWKMLFMCIVFEKAFSEFSKVFRKVFSEIRNVRKSVLKLASKNRVRAPVVKATARRWKIVRAPKIAIRRFP